MFFYDDAGVNQEDSGKYECIGRNEYGIASRSAFVQVLPFYPNLQPVPTLFDLPLDPGRPTLAEFDDALQANAILLQWTAWVVVQTLPVGQQASQSVQHSVAPYTPTLLENPFVIEYFSPSWLDNPSPTKRDISWVVAEMRPVFRESTIVWLVEGLNSSTSYYFVVRMRNKMGLGPPSPLSLPIQTRPSPPSPIPIQPFPPNPFQTGIAACFSFILLFSVVDAILFSQIFSQFSSF